MQMGRRQLKKLKQDHVLEKETRQGQNPINTAGQRSDETFRKFWYGGQACLRRCVADTLHLHHRRPRQDSRPIQPRACRTPARGCGGQSPSSSDHPSAHPSSHLLVAVANLTLPYPGGSCAAGGHSAAATQHC